MKSWPNSKISNVILSYWKINPRRTISNNKCKQWYDRNLQKWSEYIVLDSINAQNFSRRISCLMSNYMKFNLYISVYPQILAIQWILSEIESSKKHQLTRPGQSDSSIPWQRMFDYLTRILKVHCARAVTAIFLWKEGTKEESMSERSVAMSWTAKRKLRAAAAHMRELKKVKLSLPTSEHGSEPTSSSSNIIESSGYFSDPFIERSNLSDCSPWSRRRREQRS